MFEIANYGFLHAGGELQVMLSVAIIRSTSRSNIRRLVD